MTVLWFT